MGVKFQLFFQKICLKQQHLTMLNLNNGQLSSLLNEYFGNHKTVADKKIPHNKFIWCDKLIKNTIVVGRDLRHSWKYLVAIGMLLI